MRDKKAYHHAWYLKNKEKHLIRGKEYYLKNIEYIKKYRKEFRSKNREKVLLQEKGYRSTNKWKERHSAYLKKYNSIPRNLERRNEIARNRYHNDPNFKLVICLRNRIGTILKGRGKSASTMKLIGCTIKELWQHLESSPTWEPWMTRENYGLWHVDHIKACAKFNLADPAQQRDCCHWSNLQPLEATKNMRKGAQ